MSKGSWWHRRTITVGRLIIFWAGWRHLRWRGSGAGPDFVWHRYLGPLSLWWKKAEHWPTSILEPLMPSSLTLPPYH